MSCGCDAKPTAVPIAVRAGMCATCPWFPSDAGVAEPCRLTIRGSPLTQAIASPAAGCPGGRWPDASGIVQWGQRRWFGVPEPLRWVFLFRWGRSPKPVGCGCDVALKASRRGRWLDPWMAISPELRGAIAHTMAGWREMLATINGRGTAARAPGPSTPQN